MNQTDEQMFSRTLVAIFKNAVYKESDREYWEVITQNKNKIEDYVSKLGLTLIVDEMDGFCYLKQRNYNEGESEIPRLIPRHPLSYQLSLLLMLLRKHLQEFDSTTGDQRLILTRHQIIERMRLYMQDTTNEAKLIDDISRNIQRAEDMGFLRKLRGSEDSFEVQRILRSFVSADYLTQFNERLTEYQRAVDSGEAVIAGKQRIKVNIGRIEYGRSI